MLSSRFVHVFVKKAEKTNCKMFSLENSYFYLSFIKIEKKKQNAIKKQERSDL